MLNLGLESFHVAVISDAEVLQASIECQQAEMELDRALFEAQTFANNMHNYNEIVKSLKVHSSAECIAFAQELLGTSLEEDVTQSATYKAQAKKITIGRRVYRTLRNWCRYFMRFLRYIGNQISSLFKSSKSEEKPANFSVEVPISMQDLDKLGYTLKAIQDGKDISVGGEAPAADTGKAATVTAEDADAYVEKALNAIQTCEKVLEANEISEDKPDPKKVKKVMAVKKQAKKISKAAAGSKKITEALGRAKKLNTKASPTAPKTSGSMPKNKALNHLLGKDKNAKAPTGVKKLIKKR